MEVARHVQSTQNKTLVIFLINNRKKYSSRFCVLLWCKIFRCFRGSSHVHCYLLFGGCGLNGRNLLDHGTLKSAQEWIDEMSWFFACWYKFRRAKPSFNNYWVAIIKNRQDPLDHEILKSGVPLKWFD